jgi:thioredoxin 1
MKGSFDELIGGKIPVLVDFSAEWCGPCKMMAPVLLQLKNRLGSQVRIIKIDVDRNRELASRYMIHNVPTLMLFQEGEKKWSGAGVTTSGHLEDVINRNCTVS